VLQRAHELDLPFLHRRPSPRADRTIAHARARAVTAATPWRVLAAVLLLILLWAVRQPVLILFGAVLVAATLRALADPLVHRGWLPARAAVLVVVLAMIALAAIGVALLGGPLAEQIQAMRSALPAAWESVKSWLQRVPIGSRVLEGLSALEQRELPLQGLAGFAADAVAAVSSLGLILLVGVYLAVDVRQYRDGIVRLMPVAQRARMGDALDATGRALTRWVLGQGVMMLAIGVAVAIGLSLLGVPLALALGLIAGLLEFVPFFGPIASGALAVLVAFAQGPAQAMYVALLFVVLQQVEENLLVPLVQRWAVDLPPVVSLASVLVFGTLLGPLGVILGTPLAVVLMVMLQRLYVARLDEGRG
jgi:predicted PurR-regulated permease PerM